MPTNIPYADETWPLTYGCTKRSPGCDNCYAEGIAMQQRRQYGNPNYAEVTDDKGWTGTIKLCDAKTLKKPMHWRKPRRIFPCAMSDLFHPGVPFSHIREAFIIMGCTQQHTYQVLTKRPARMLEFVKWIATAPGAAVGEWPLPNVYLGATCENQAALDERWPYLDKLSRMGWKTWISAEPLLGPLDIVSMLTYWPNAVVVGAESGPRARSFDLEWARAIRAQCEALRVPFYMKQVGPVLGKQLCMRDPKGGEFDLIPEDVRIREVWT